MRTNHVRHPLSQLGLTIAVGLECVFAACQTLDLLGLCPLPSPFAKRLESEK